MISFKEAKHCWLPDWGYLVSEQKEVSRPWLLLNTELSSIPWHCFKVHFLLPALLHIIQDICQLGIQILKCSPTLYSHSRQDSICFKRLLNKYKLCMRKYAGPIKIQYWNGNQYL